MHISVCHKIMPVKDCFIFQRQERHSRQILYIYKCNTLGNESYRKVKPRLYAFDLHKIILFTGTIHTRRSQDHIREMRLVAHIVLRFQLTTDKYIILKQRNWICDVTPLQEELGFTPEYPLRKGLEESIEWYCKEGWL